MPGYLVSQQKEPSNVFSEQESTDINQVYDKNFYGFKFDAINGKLTVAEIDDNDMVISLPEEDKIDDTDYKTWIWSKTKLNFSWNQNKKTNILMEML